MTTTDDSEPSRGILYQPDQNPPAALTLGLGLQLVTLCVASIVLTPAIVIRAAGGSEVFLSWAVFAAVIVSGISSVLQARRVGRVGAGYVLAMGTIAGFQYSPSIALYSCNSLIPIHFIFLTVACYSCTFFYCPW